MLIRQSHLESVLFATIVIFLDEEFMFQPAVFNCYHGVLIMSIDLRIIAILNIYGVEYHCIINGNSKSEAIYKFTK